MARMINSERVMVMSLGITTVFNDGTSMTHEIDKGLVYDDFRYVSNKQVVEITGRVVGFGYSLPNNITWDADNPVDTLADDVRVDNILLDASEQYESKLVTIPVDEIVEFADEDNVKRMVIKPRFTLNITLHYSNNTSRESSIRIGDTFDNVVIMDPNNIGEDITGTFTVKSFGYRMVDRKLEFNKIALEDSNGNVTVHDMDHIFNLNEIYSYEPKYGDLALALTAADNLANGDSLVIGGALDTTSSSKPITIRANANVELKANVIAANSNTSGFVVTGSTATFSGEGKLVSTTPYDSTHSTGVININADGKAIFNGSGIDCVVEDDPASKGQFGIVYRQNGSVEVNDGDFRAGWYCLSGNGSSTNDKSEVVINGGNIVSVADYAIYHPHTGKLTINGGFISGPAGAVAAQAGVINITGGVLSSTGSTTLSTDWSDGTAGLGNAALNLNAKYNDITCTISGGRFIAEGNASIVAIGTNHKVNLSITGGEFSVKPDDAWIAEGYYCKSTKNADGFYEVVKEA